MSVFVCFIGLLGVYARLFEDVLKSKSVVQMLGFVIKGNFDEFYRILFIFCLSCYKIYV